MADPRLDIDTRVIESPCTVPWASMRGDEVKRFCGECRLHVHDVSKMTRREANDLLAATNGEVCLRIWRRPDGRVITKDCGRVRRALRRRARALAAAVAGCLAFLGLGGCTNVNAEDGPGVEPDPAHPAGEPSPGEIVDPPAKETPPVKGAQVWTGK